jgi:hypothetical protein
MVVMELNMEHEYSLTINTGSEKRTLYDPSPEEIDTAINELLPVDYHFVVLFSQARVGNCDYIQTIICEDDCDTKLKYHVEVRFQYTKNYPGDFSQHKYYTTDIDEVKRLFRMFALGVIPDTSAWEDITENTKNLPSIEEQREKKKQVANKK